ncbi:DUF72 domain-containing protein [Caulobacter mirabilis]|uniref:DUF72 domain-containing protein n=1 Tax=Caulobacter mirabilis TaxID=69666 RepID=A0A2D2ASE1_9CAUL|nr:DUF72 domain-containing protein [Caulobacter mirabilis]ATQ40924.1 hypothetical protein CSW64_00130 [Caulobacter mirabilis]
MSASGQIRTGCGGWTFEPWRGVFYPDTLKQKDELNYMSRRLRSIEINGTYYSSFKPDSWRKWRDETPDGFVFAVKGSRFTTNRRVLAEAGESIEKFMTQGMTELGAKLGPVFWQFAPTKKFDPDDFGAFLALLPRTVDGVKIRHAVEVRHDSFCTPAFPALLREHGVANIYAKHQTYPEIADVTADFVYARLQTGSDDVETAYAPAELKAWADRLQTWAGGGDPDDLPRVDPGHAPAKAPRDVFAYIIHEGKVRAPHGAEALQKLADQ